MNLSLLFWLIRALGNQQRFIAAGGNSSSHLSGIISLPQLQHIIKHPRGGSFRVQYPVFCCMTSQSLDTALVGVSALFQSTRFAISILR